MESPLIGKSLHLRVMGPLMTEGHEAFLFNVKDVRKNFRHTIFICDQIVTSSDTMFHNDLEVHIHHEQYFSIEEGDDIIAIYNTPEELFDAVCDYLKQQMKRCTGLEI